MAGEAALVALLTADAALVALVVDRVYPTSDIPVDCPLPYVSYSLVSEVRAIGAGTNPGLLDSRLQLDCVARTYAQAKELAAAVAVALDRKTGTHGGETVLDVRVDNEVDQYSFEADRRWVVVDAIVSTKQ